MINKEECKASPDKKHHLPRSCACSISALEPDDNCPMHGHNTNNRCNYCGQFMKVKAYDEEAN